MPATKAEIAAYARKLTQIERRFGTLERGTLSRSIDLLKQLRSNVAGELTHLSDWEQFRILQTRTNLDALITQYQGQLTGLSNGAIKGSYRLGQASVLEPLEQLGLTNLYFQPSPAQVNALVDFSADLVGGVSNDLRKVINREIQLASLGGKSVTQTMKDITLKMGIPARKSDPVKGIAYDAERILRTEMNRAHNLAAQSQQTELAQQVPGMRKQWLSTGDARTRMTHLDAHGKVVPVDKPFQVGGASLMFPGDPAGPAHETINCRCRSVTVIPEVEDLSLPIDAEVQAEKDRRDELPAAKKAKRAQMLAAEKAIAKSLGDSSTDIFANIRAPAGRAPRGLGKEYAARRRIEKNITKHMKWRSQARSNLVIYRGQKRGRWRIDVAKDRIRELNKAIPTMLDIAENSFGDWTFVDDLIKGIAGQVSAVRVMGV